MSDKKESLTWNEKRDLVIQASMEAIPYFGGSLSTLYFGTKQETRFKRIELFYAELSHEIEQIKDQIPPFSIHDKEAFTAIIEELNEKIETENLHEKIEYFKRYFKNTLLQPVTIGNYDQRRFFLQTLSTMSLLDCELLTGFFDNCQQPVIIGGITKPGIDQYALIGSIGRLKTFGFIATYTVGISFGGKTDNTLKDNAQITNYGKQFCRFCLSQ